MSQDAKASQSESVDQTDGDGTSNLQTKAKDSRPKSEDLKGKDRFVFFYGKNSPFSQHYPVDFEIDDVKFNCAEQYMMYMKAVTFKDSEMAQKILKTDKPVEQKRYGRKVRNFDADVWNRECKKIVSDGNEAKFSQNPELKKQLFATFPRTFVEASPRDRRWGIGLGKDNPKAWDKSTWRGKNQLGYILTDVRDKLMKDEELIDSD